MKKPNIITIVIIAAVLLLAVCIGPLIDHISYELRYGTWEYHIDLAGEDRFVLQDYKAAFDLDSRNVQVLMSLSNIYQKRKDNEMALQYASYATEIPGAPAMAFFLKGRAYHLLGNTDNAMAEYNTAIKIDDNFGQAYYYRGMLKRAVKQNKGACSDFKLAASLNYEQADQALENYCQ